MQRSKQDLVADRSLNILVHHERKEREGPRALSTELKSVGGTPGRSPVHLVITSSRKVRNRRGIIRHFTKKESVVVTKVH